MTPVPFGVKIRSVLLDVMGRLILLRQQLLPLPSTQSSGGI